MSSASCPDCSCPDPVVVEIPGVEGESGATGQAAMTFTDETFIVPNVNLTAVIPVIDTTWLTGDPAVADPAGINLFIPGAGYFSIVSVSPTSIVGLYLNIIQNTNAGLVIPAGTPVIPTGPRFQSSIIPTITDLSGGTAGITVEPGVGIQTLTFYVNATAIADGDLVSNYVPGYNFKLLKFDARCSAPVTTGAKAADINLEINATNVSGGDIPLAGTYALGAAQAGSAITGNNTGSATDNFSIEIRNTVAFVEGAFTFIISIQNLDTLNAASTFAETINDILLFTNAS